MPKYKEKDILRYDNAFLSFLGDHPVESLEFSSVINKDILKKCGYFESFPNYLISLLPIDKSKYEDVSRSNDVVKEHLTDDVFFLAPASCLQVYPHYGENCRNENKLFTTKLTVFRNEDAYNEVRLNEFTMREFVAIGEDGFVTDILETIKEKSVAFSKECFHEASLVFATDIFIPTKKNNVKEKLQRKNKQKIELQVNYKETKLAIASFNYHNTHFSEAYKFHDKGKIVSGCAAYGIERWIAKEIDNG